MSVPEWVLSTFSKPESECLSEIRVADFCATIWNADLEVPSEMAMSLAWDSPLFMSPV